MDYASRLDLYAIGRDYVIQRARRLYPAQVDVAGTDVNVFTGSMSEVAFALILQLAYATNRLLLDNAEGDDLDRYAWDRYQIVRKGAASAKGVIRVFRASAGPLGDIPIGTKLVSLTNVEYVTTSTIHFEPGDTSRTGNVTATTAGAATKVGANALRRFVDTVFDSNLEVTNDIATAGGEDAEDDEIFRDRIRTFWLAARRGVLSAIEFGAKTVPGIFSAQAVEVISPLTAAPARVVVLYVSDGSGNSNAALAAVVQAALSDWRAAGIQVIVSSSTPQIVNIILALTFLADVDTQSLRDNVVAAVVEFVNNLPVNSTLFRAQLFAMLQRFVADGLVVTHDTIVAPTGDLVPDQGKTLRTFISNVMTQ